MTNKEQKDELLPSVPLAANPLLAAVLFVVKLIAWGVIIAIAIVPSIMIIYIDGILYYLKVLGIGLLFIGLFFGSIWVVSINSR